MNSQNAAGTSQSNAQEGSTADAKGTQRPLFFFYPDTAELFECPVESVDAVAKEIALMSRLSENLIEARQALGVAHAAWLEQQANVALRPQLEANLKEAIKKEEAATAEVHEQLEETPAFNKDGVWELLPLRKTAAGKDKYSGQRFTYVRSSKMKNHFRRYKLDSDKPQLKSFLVKDATTGNYKLDHEKIQEKLDEAFKKAKLHEWKTPPWGREWAPEFAEAFNKAAKFKSPDDPNAMCEFSGGTQILRLFAGAGASAKAESTIKSFDDLLHLRGEVAASAKAKGEVGGVLADGNIKATLYLPWKSGLELWIPAPTESPSGAISWKSTPDTTLGFFRISLAAKAEASCGASLLAEGGVEFKLGRDGKTQKVKGTRATRNAAQMQQPKLDVTKVEVKADAGGDLKAFAGVEAEASVEGAFEWRRPQEKVKWTSFASVKPGVSGQAGAGAQAAFHITYDDKFRILMRAGLCVGVGLKGEVEAAVDVVNMAEFAWWAKTQIAYAGDKNLQYFAKDAFRTFVAMYTLAIAKGKEIGAYVGKQFDEMRTELTDFIRTQPRAFLNAIRNAHDSLLNSLAEVKGYIVYALKSIADRFDEWRLEATDAISRILAAAQIRNELENVYQFTSSEIAVKGNAQVARNEIGQVVGTSQLAMVESRMRVDPAPGFGFVFNDSAAYQMQQGTALAWMDPKTTAGDGSQMA
jgi:ribosomal protein L32